jgi:arabinose operon protein AraL
VFLSNKPLFSRKAYAEKLCALGIPAQEDEVITSSWVLARELAKEAPEAKVFAIGETPLLEELTRIGLTLTEDPEEIEYVIAAFDRTFDYRKLNIAFQALKRGAHFYATNPDRTCPVEGGEIPDAAAVIAALEATTGRKVEKIFGKPSRYMIQTALEVLGLPLGEMCDGGRSPRNRYPHGQRERSHRNPRAHGSNPPGRFERLAVPAGLRSS